MALPYPSSLVSFSGREGDRTRVVWAETSNFISRVSRYVWGTSEEVTSQLIANNTKEPATDAAWLLLQVEVLWDFSGTSRSTCHLWPGKTAKVSLRAKRHFLKGTFWTLLQLFFSASGGVHGCLDYEGASCAACCQHWLTGLSVAYYSSTEWSVYPVSPRATISRHWGVRQPWEEVWELTRLGLFTSRGTFGISSSRFDLVFKLFCLLLFLFLSTNSKGWPKKKKNPSPFKIGRWKIWVSRVAWFSTMGAPSLPENARDNPPSPLPWRDHDLSLRVGWSQGLQGSINSMMGVSDWDKD